MKNIYQFFLLMTSIILSSLFLFSLQVEACQLSIPQSDVARFLAPPVVGAYLKCEDYPNDKCHCVDKINSWYAVEIDNLVLDYVAKLQPSSCIDQADCDAKFSSLVCAEGSPIKNYDPLEVYCAKDVMKIDGKKLVEDDAKKAAYKAAQAASEGLTRQEIIDLKAAITEIQDVTDIDAATTVAQLRNVTKEKVKRIGRVLKFFMREMKGN